MYWTKDNATVLGSYRPTSYWHRLHYQQYFSTCMYLLTYKCKNKCAWLQCNIPMSSANFAIHTPSIRTLSYGFISSGENSAHFLQIMPSQFSIFPSTRYPSLLGRQRQHDMRGLPDTSLHVRQCDWTLVRDWQSPIQVLPRLGVA